MRCATRHLAATAIAVTAVFYVAGLPLRLHAADAESTTPHEQSARILSLGGDVTEILYDLGQAEKVVAIDSTSQFPAQAVKDKRNIGYLRALSAEGVLSVNPTLIIASEQAGPPEVVKALKSTSIRYVEVDSKETAAGIPQKVRFIGDLMGVHEAGEALATKIEAEFNSLAADRGKLAKRKRALFILAVQNGRATVGGRDTGADSILELAGAENAAAGITGYKAVSDEELLEFAPDAIVVMRRGHGDDHATGQALTLPGLSRSPAAKTGRVIEMDGLYLLGFGPRAPSAARDLMNALYASKSEALPALKP